MSLTTCRDCGRRFQLQPLLDLPQPTRCMECLIGLEARYSREVSERRSLEAALSQKVGMRREFEELLGCGDTYADGAFETGLARLRALLAAEARVASLERQRSEHDCRFVGKYAEMSGSHCPPGNPCQRCQLEAAEARCAELEAALEIERENRGREQREAGETLAWHNRAWSDRCYAAEARCAELEAALRDAVAYVENGDFRNGVGEFWADEGLTLWSRDLDRFRAVLKGASDV